VTRWLDRARLPLPINSAKLTMLLEGNVIADPAENDLVTRLGVKPTSLHDGLRMLADLLPEQVPGDGVGAIQVTRYSAEITGSTLSPEQLMDRICENMADVMPLDFVAEPGAPEAAREGETMTAAIPGRGNIQVRVEERNPRTVTFATLEGHPLAGILEFEVQPVDDRLRIIVQIASQPANALDWIAMKTVGGPMQTANWRAVVRRIVGLSGGTAPDGVERASRTLDDEEGFAVSLASRRFIQHQQRLHKEAQIAHANVIPT
jgi:NADH dehydrogenase